MAGREDGTDLVTTLRRYARRTYELLRYGAAGAPVSITLLAVMWVLGFATDSIVHGPGQFVDRHLAVGIGPVEHWRLWTSLSAGLWAPGLAGYLGATVLVSWSPPRSSAGWGRGASHSRR